MKKFTYITLINTLAFVMTHQAWASDQTDNQAPKPSFIQPTRELENEGHVQKVRVLVDADQQIQDSRQERQKLGVQVNALLKEYESLLASIKKYQSEQSVLEQRVQAKLKILKNLEETHQFLENQISILQKSLKTLKEKNATAQETSLAPAGTEDIQSVPTEVNNENAQNASPAPLIPGPKVISEWDRNPTHQTTPLMTEPAPAPAKKDRSQRKKKKFHISKGTKEKT